MSYLVVYSDDENQYEREFNNRVVALIFKNVMEEDGYNVTIILAGVHV